MGGVALIAARPIFINNMARYTSKGAISLVAGGRLIRFTKGSCFYEYITEDPKKIATLDRYAKGGMITKDEAQAEPEPMLTLVTEAEGKPKKPSKSKKK